MNVHLERVLVLCALLSVCACASGPQAESADEVVLYDGQVARCECAPPETYTPQPTYTLLPTYTPYPTQAPPPTSTGTAAPTDTPQPTQAPPPTSTPQPTPTAAAEPWDELIVDDADPAFSTAYAQDEWVRYESVDPQHYNGGHHYNTNLSDALDVAQWAWDVPRDGRYEVFAYWYAGDYRPTDVPYHVHHGEGVALVRVDQTRDGGQWNSLGVFPFLAGQRGLVEVTDGATNGRNVVADAVRIVYLGPLGVSTPQPGAATIYDHRHVDPSQLSAADRQRAANAIVYFNHQSVGQDILDNMPYWGEMRIERDERALPGINHTTYGSNRDYASKLEAFEQTVQAGHQIAFQKFCYVDFPLGVSGQEVFNAYRATIERMQARYPDTTFVWWTAPVQTTANARRAEFNRLVRAHVQANGGILFDMADIESDGGRCGEDLMCPAYTDDGGHPNTVGGRRAAGALWVMLARLG